MSVAMDSLLARQKCKAKAPRPVGEIGDSLLYKSEVARILAVSISTVERLVASGKLKCVDLGHRTKRFRPADVERMKARLAGDSKPEDWLNV